MTNSEKLRAALNAAIDLEKKGIDAVSEFSGAFIEVFIKPGGEADVILNPKTRHTVSTR